MKNFTVYKSSAGSGKTFTLVKEYLKLALKTDSRYYYTKILAITFTNKAANEMKERILSTLKEIIATNSEKPTEDQHLIIAIQKELAIPFGDIKVRAQNTLSHILHNYSDFAVGTIDSFVHKIVRTFATDLKLSPNFEVEMDTNKMINLVVDNILAKVGTDKELTKILVEFTKSKTSDEKSWRIENEIASFTERSIKEDSIQAIQKLKSVSLSDFENLKKDTATKIKNFESSVQNIAEQAIELIASHGISQDSFSYKTGGPQNIFYKLKSGNFANDTFDGKRSKSAFEKGELCGKTSPQKEEITNITHQLTQYYNSIQELANNGLASYNFYKIINPQLFTMALVNEIGKAFNEVNSETNKISPSSFNKKIQEQIITQPIPFIYERLGERYKHFLIDEFQDTSTLQFHNFLPLIENSLSEANFNMLVGDGKQAIYRWRDGEVEQFANLPKIETEYHLIKQKQALLEANYEDKALKQNFRSKRELIEFNNDFFEKSKFNLSEDYQKIYDNHSQEFDAKKTGGFVKIEALENEKDIDFTDTNAIKTLALINELKVDNFELKDIAIICRSNKVASKIANYLMQNNIDVISSESLLLNVSTDVNFIINCIQFLSNTNDKICKTSLIHYLCTSNKIEADFSVTIKNVIQNNGAYFEKLLNGSGFKFKINELIQLPIYELTEELIRIFKLTTTTNAYIDFLLNVVYDYSNKQGNNLLSFVEWWHQEKGKFSIIVPEGKNAVSIMTIHKAKGLEFPAVIVPQCNWTFKKGKDNLWIEPNKDELNLPTALLNLSKSLEKTNYAEHLNLELNKTLLDNINMLYVAFTRPKNRLYILTETYSPPKEKSSDLITSCAELIYNYLDGKTDYKFGALTKYISKDDKKPNTINLEPLNNSSWHDKIRIKKSRLLQQGDMSSCHDNMKANEWGLLVHSAMEKIRTSKDVAKVLNQMLYDGEILKTQKTELHQKLKNLLEQKQLAPYFTDAYQSLNELEILLHDGTSLRPDKVAIKNKQATIIDYKTGAKDYEKHSKQLNQYAFALQEMGYTINQKLVVYIEDEEVVNI